MKTRSYKIHFHSEQFDHYFHSACERVDKSYKKGKNRFVSHEEEFEAIPYEKRCRLCARVVYPKGGEPR